MFITKVVIQVKRVGQLDANKKIYYNLPGATSLFSSLEGHALLLLQGYGFMNLQDANLACVFTSVTASETFVYKSKVQKDKTTCDATDYNCIYWQTSYLFSDTQIGCYTPKIPETDRLRLFSATNNWPRMVITLEVTSENMVSSLSCGVNSYCFIIYTLFSTSNLVSFAPAHFYIGQTLTMRFQARSNSIENLLSVKIGRNNCLPSVPEGSNSGDMLLNCETSDSYIPETITDFAVDFRPGFISVPPFFQKDNIDLNLTNNKSKFYFKAFPRIDGVSSNKVVTKGGLQVTIYGAGFISSKTKVFLDKDECTKDLEVSNSGTKIKCTLPSLNYDSSVLNYTGSNGLRWRIYSLPNGSMTSLGSLAGFPDSTTVLTKDDILLETMTAPSLGVNYGQYITGYFKALFTGSYKFWLTSDDASQVYLSTDSTTTNKVKIIDFTSWTLYNDYVSENIVSENINLSAGQLYYFEIRHTQGVGAEHLAVGVEIQTSGVDTSLVDPLPNAISRIQLLSITPKVSRDVYEFIINSLVANTYKLTCRSSDGTSTNSILIDPTKSAQSFMNALNGIIPGGSLLVRKLGYNDANKYYLQENASFDDASYTSKYSFKDMYINLEGSQSEDSIPINTVSTGTQTGYVFLVMIDKKYSDRAYAWENNCYLSTSSSPTILIKKKQSVSPQLSGTFSLVVTETVDGKSVETKIPDFDITKISAGSIQNSLWNYGFLFNKVQVYYKLGSLEVCNIYLRIHRSLNVVLKFTDEQLNGGINTPTTSVTDFVAANTNLFFFPIPADFLYVQSSAPQLRVVSNGFEAVCPQTKCSFSIIDSTTLPSVTSATYDSNTNTVTATLSAALSDMSEYNPGIKVGPSVCGLPLNWNSGTNTFTCTLTNPIVAGSYFVDVTTTYGNLNKADSLTKIDIGMTITSVTPTSVTENGGVVISIVGTCFPLTIDDNFTVSVGSSACKIQTVTNTLCTCLTSAKISDSSDGLLQITYNSINVKATNDQFKYTSASETPVMQSISPNSVAPGNKQDLQITFDVDISSYNINNIKVKIVHSTIANNIIYLNPKGISEKVLTVRYGGAKKGVYNIYINLNESTLAKGSITLTSALTLDSISPNIGSVLGGSLLTLNGSNFLSTSTNQIVFIGKTQCTVISTDSSKITCLTNAPNSSTPKDENQNVVVEQMIQHDTDCTSTCVFKYSSEHTAVIVKVESANKDAYFGLNDSITITGTNFKYTSSPSKLTFDWGEITVTESDLTTVVIGTVSKITKYGVFAFNFYNDYGLATHKAESAVDSTVYIALKKASPDISSITPKTVTENGAVFQFFTSVTDFASEKTNYVTICGKVCKVLSTNLITGDQNSFQCSYINRMISSSFTNCPIVLYYYGNSFPLSQEKTISSNASQNYAISTIDTSNLSVSSSNFYIKVTLNSNKIDFMNLRLSVDNRYSFKAGSVELSSSNKAVYKFDFANGLPAGTWTAAIFEDSIGYLSPPSSLALKDSSGQVTSTFNLNIPAVVNSNEQTVYSSFFGGVPVQITGSNFNKLITGVDTEVTTNGPVLQSVTVCGIEATIVQSTSALIKFETPTILKYDIFSSTKLIGTDLKSLQDLNSLVEVYKDSSTTSIANLIDNNPYTTTSTSPTSCIGYKIKSTVNANFKILLKKVKIFVGQSAMPADFGSGIIEGSNDGTTWTKIVDLPSNLPFLWYTVNIDSNNRYSYVRLSPKVQSQLAEIRFLGYVVYDSNDSTLTCDVNVVDSFNNVPVSKLKITYDTTKTFTLSSISPNSGPSTGGATVTFTLANGNVLTGSETIEIKVYGSPLTEVTINNSSSPHSISAKMSARPTEIFDSLNPLSININSIGDVYSDFTYQYIDRWSDTATWGGEYIPANGETAYITNTNVLLDVANVDLNTLVVENGSLVVEDQRDYKLSAMNILIRSGQFSVGSESQRFSHKFELTLKSRKTDPTLPIFGNKVLAVLEGQLEMHGLVRNPTYSLLSKTTKLGDSTINVIGPVDWKVGEDIVIASSSIYPTEAEQRTISAISGESTATVVITLDSSLQFVHYGDLETYDNETIDMRAEVVLLTRNVVVQGDENSESQQYGSHIMLTAMKMNMNTDSNAITRGRLSYIEVRKAGQAFQLGRYPIHFHMIGDVTGSYVKGCSIHHTYNRALTIHAVNNFLVESNVAYNVMGHTFFIEDGVETNNIIKNNVGINTRSSSSLLLTDYHPATFWITNPSNFFEGNRACGSRSYGFWMDLPDAPTGLNLGVAGCPKEMPLGSFKNNISHSNGSYGLRIFPEFNPKNKPCQPIDGTNVIGVQALFQGVTLYRNAERGMITELVNNLVFDGFKAVDNVVSSLEISRVFPLNGGTTTDATPSLTTIIQNAIIVGRSKNPNSENAFKTYGIIAPRSDRLLVNGVNFYSFATAGSALFSSCSRCEVSNASTDSDARTNYFKGIKTDNTQTMMVKWAIPRRAIFRDLDGSLTGQSGPGWVTPFYAHHTSAECKKDSKYDDGLICNDSVQIRRVAFSQAPSTFNGQPMKILKLPGNVNSVTPILLSDPTLFSVIPFKEKTDPINGWAVPFVTGYNYMISFGNIGLDFSSIALERSSIWSTNDKPINLAFNYTLRRDEFNITGKKNDGSTFIVKNTTDLTAIASAQTNNNLPYGTFYNNIGSKSLYMRVNSFNPDKIINNMLTITAIQCSNNDCAASPPPIVVPETFVRKWSDASNWPNKQVPGQGSSPEILSEWNMILDVSTADLKKLTVYGSLIWDPKGDNIELKSNNIINMGTISIGDAETAYTNTAKITLTGNRFGTNIALNNGVQLTNKALINVGKLSLYGQDRSPYSAKLLSTAKAGATEIKVTPGLKWKNGDEIILSTTSFYFNETERFTITSYTNDGTIGLNSPLKYSHYGAAAATTFADNPLNPPVNLDERADVYMITRNIKISGSDEDWGCNIFTTKYQPLDVLYTGRTNISHAEVFRCGQTDTSFSAIQFEKHDAASYLNGLSLHDNYYSGLSIVNSNNIFVSSFVAYKLMKYGVYVMNSVNIALTDVNIVSMLKRPYPPQLPGSKLLDNNACFYVCPETNTCKSVTLNNSTCAGSEFFGFMVDSFDCSTDLTKNYNYNRVYASEIGIIPFNLQGRECSKYGNIISYRNFNGYAFYSPSDLTIHENIIYANNLQAMVVMSASSKPNPRRRLNRALIVGQNKENPVCFDDICPAGKGNCKQSGLILSTSTLGEAFKLPMTKMNFPLHDVKADATFGSFFDGQSISFVNWEGTCLGPQFAINSNGAATDYISIHNFKNVTLTRVSEDNFIYFEDVDDSIIRDKNLPCGPDFGCTGPNTALVKINSFNPSKETFDAINPTTRKKYIKPSDILDTSSLIRDGTSFIISKPFTKLSLCTSESKWNSLVCNPLKKMGVLTFQNVDNEANTRSISPVNIQDLDAYEIFDNKLNSFMDHSCQFGYPSDKRTPIFPSVLTLNKNYRIKFASTNPEKLKIQLQDSQWDDGSVSFDTYTVIPQIGVPDGVLMELEYQKPVTVLVYNLISGKEVAPRIWREDDVFGPPFYSCGMSRWTSLKNILQVYINTSPDCLILLKPSNAVQLSLRMDMTITDFYSNKDQNISMIYKIAAVLGISTEQIRIAGVTKGSTIVNFNVLESPPPATITDADVGNVVTITTPTPNVNLDKVATNIASRIKDGSIELPARVLEMTQIARTVTSASSNDINSNTNSTVTPTSDQSNVVISFNDPVVSNNTTNSSLIPVNINNTVTPSVPENVNPNNQSDPDKIKNLYIIIFTTVPVCLIIIGVVTVICVKKCKKKRQDEETKVLKKETEPNTNLIEGQQVRVQHLEMNSNPMV